MTVVIAETQTAGRGRYDRQWHSPAGNLYATFCFFLEKSREDFLNLPQVTALGVAKIIASQGLNPELKWPNDILINGLKIAGILTETLEIEQQRLCIIGLGLNLNHEYEGGTSLKKELGKEFGEFPLQEMTEILKEFIQEGFQPFIDGYKKYLRKEGLIKFTDRNQTWKGTFHSITNNGKLQLQLSTGEIKTFSSGEFLN